MGSRGTFPAMSNSHGYVLSNRVELCVEELAEAHNEDSDKYTDECDNLELRRARTRRVLINAMKLRSVNVLHKNQNCRDIGLPSLSLEW